jgi:hypothetical protein
MPHVRPRLLHVRPRLLHVRPRLLAGSLRRHGAPQVVDWTFELVEMRMRAGDWLPDGGRRFGRRTRRRRGDMGSEGSEDSSEEGGGPGRNDDWVRVGCYATWREVQVRSHRLCRWTRWLSRPPSLGG